MRHIRLSFISLLALIIVQYSHAGCTPVATAGNDTVTCTGVINSYQHFYGGSDTVSLNAVTARTYSNVYWLDEALGGNPATDGNDTFEANASQFHWVLGFGGDDSFTITNSEFNNAYGDTNPGHGTSQRGNDTFLIENSISYGYILGGNDNDTITIIDSNVSNVASGYSDIYAGTDYTPYDGNDTILLDHVNFTAPLYWDATQLEGMVGGGRGDDTIAFRHGGEAYYVYGGHGNDIIEIFDNEQFHACMTSPQNTDRCGIYGDESYASEPNASAIPILHGDDRIILHNGNANGILIQGGDGSDVVTIETPVVLNGTELNGGDDTSASDTFVDRITFEQWTGDLNGSQFYNWEQIQLRHESNITLDDSNLSVGIDSGSDAISGLPYGIIIDEDSALNLYHDFVINGNLHNNAILNLQDGNPSGTLLEINGGYTASSGNIYMDTVLNGNYPGTSDVLHIHGDTAGDTQLYIQNIGGNGAQTTGRGILLVKIDGNSNAVFTLDSEPLLAGDYLYTLYKADDGNWYLHSIKNVPSITIKKTVDKAYVSKPGHLNYTITLENTGYTSLSSIYLKDIYPDGTSIILTFYSGDTNNNQYLDPGEKWIYTTSYVVTQDDIDRGLPLINHAYVSTSEGANGQSFTMTQIEQHSAYRFVKKTISVPHCIGDSLRYTFTLKNTGNTRLKLNKITDTNCKSNIALTSESVQKNGILDLGETQVYTCTSLPVTAYEANVCKVVNVANVSVKTNLSNHILPEQTSKVLTPVTIQQPAGCDCCILTRPPLMPSNAKALLLTSKSATIQWADNAFNEIGFKIYQGKTLIKVLSKNVTSVTLGQLKPNTTYTYTIRAYNKYGESYRTMITFTTKDDFAWLPAIYNLTL
jgi:uncharacterized repeat protein (TIGR01451 family)